MVASVFLQSDLADNGRRLGRVGGSYPEPSSGSDAYGYREKCSSLGGASELRFAVSAQRDRCRIREFAEIRRSPLQPEAHFLPRCARVSPELPPGLARSGRALPDRSSDWVSLPCRLLCSAISR